MKTVSKAFLCLLFLVCMTFSILPPAYAAMNDYCITPPFIVGGVTPNLLLTIDNSASMFDLAYVDKGSTTRTPYYCYDQTYNFGNHYVGYFKDWYHYYEYDFPDDATDHCGGDCFYEVSAPTWSGCSKYINGTLCINGTNLDNTTTPKTVTRFVAEGNYLNWLSSSKMDVEKWVLTGGKSTQTGGNWYLLPESRGCVGRGFVKEAITAQNFQEYTPCPATCPAASGGAFNCDPCDPNTSLKISFRVKGPPDPYNSSAVSQGGQTYIDIFAGTSYNQAICQHAVDVITADANHDGVPDYNHLVWRNAVADCLASLVGADTTVETKEKVVFQQSVQECWQYWRTTPHSVGDPDAANTVKNQCPEVLKRCSLDSTKTCTKDSQCAPGTCIYYSPATISVGSPGLLCSQTYAGSCATVLPGSVTWGSNDCIIAAHNAFCGAMGVPPVVDPTNDPSVSSTYDNLPALIADLGIQAQLDQPVKTLTVKLRDTTEPRGLLQDFSGLLRFGVMTFNYNGTPTECVLSGSGITCPKNCSITTSKTCTINLDCPATESCVSSPGNLDGAKVVYHIRNYCSSAATLCNADSDCPAGETCTGIRPVGDHMTADSLLKTIDDIRAATWTPFSEAFYNAIGYFANARSGDTYGAYLRINPGDFDETKPPSQYACQKNNILLITDGMSTADLNSSAINLVSSYNDGDGQINTAISATCPKFAGTRNLDDLAWLAKHRNIKNFTQTPAVSDTELNRKTVTTYVVNNGAVSSEPGECNPDTLLSQTALNGCGTATGCYQKADDPTQLYNALRNAFQNISGAAASGTAASVLATGEGSGANLVQALFYPELTVSGTTVTWSGSLKNMWYFIDPRLGNSSIRADSDSDKELELTNDDIVHFRFDQADNITKADLYRDADGDGIKDSGSPYSSVYFENVKSIWEASGRLWSTSPADRTIYTTTDGATRILFNTPLTDTSPLISLLQAGTNRLLAERIISYVRGTDYNSKFCSSTVSTACTVSADCPAGEECINYRNRTVTISGTPNTLKLGDVINSTPRIASWVPLNTYYDTYKDRTYKDFTQKSTYTNRGTVFVGANDGMIHAFYLGKLSLFDEKNRKASITDPAGIGLGKEQWAFVPKNMLPYLRYMADTSYCHLYYVDATPYLFDASIDIPAGCSGSYWDCTKTADSWKTLLIGSMRFGGACKDPTDSNSDGRADSCTKDLNQDSSITNDDCVITPSSGVGYSSYFALDITDPMNPQVMWEFSHPNLGFSSSGPAIVRIGDKSKNGRWFVVIGSGPTGPIDKTTHQMKGYSDQNLRVFILDLKGPSSGTWTLNTDYWVKDSGLQNAFTGSMINAPIDLDQNNPASSSYYQDDALYFGYTRAENNPITTSTKWNVGGVLRLFTKNNLTDPGSQWALSRVIPTSLSSIGPVTSAIAKLQNYSTGKLYLFFGTGRYYFKIADNIDDPTSARSLYGVVEPCYSTSGLDLTCTDSVSRTDLGDADAGAASDDDGWYITLDSCTDASGNTVLCSAASALYKTERNVTDPLATTIGAVFFTTTKPSANVCEFGGASHLWAVKYDTGGTVASKLRGRALMQVSTGSIEEVDLKTAFTRRGNRQGALVQGVPPTGTPPGIILPAKPMNKILHIREK
jgi:type IV pilus assembly protein PilY1